MTDNQFDHDEFKESYAHYRHLEQERSRHLTFFFMLVGGLFGVLGFVLKDGKSIIGTDWFLFLICISVVFLQVFEIFTYVSVRRVGDAREQHRKTIRYLRDKLSNDSYVVDLWKSFEKRPHVSVQAAAEIILHAFSLLFLAAGIRSAIYVLALDGMHVCEGVVVLGLVIIAFAARIFTYARLRPPR